MKKKTKIHKDKNGLDYLKESYFAGGKMRFRRIYLIEGMPEENFYKENASDIDRLINGEYWEISYEKDFINNSDESTKRKTDSSDNELDDLPF